MPMVVFIGMPFVIRSMGNMTGCGNCFTFDITTFGTGSLFQTGRCFGGFCHSFPIRIGMPCRRTCLEGLSTAYVTTGTFIIICCLFGTSCRRSKMFSVNDFFCIVTFYYSNLTGSGNAITGGSNSSCTTGNTGNINTITLSINRSYIIVTGRPFYTLVNKVTR